MRKTTIYVNTEDETAETCFDVITHNGRPDVLETGVNMAGHYEHTAIAVVDSGRAGQFIDAINHAPGCQVTGYETH